MFEILMYLFENYMDGDITLKADQGSIMDELKRAGFGVFEIRQALEWLEGLVQVQEMVEAGPACTKYAIRHYSPEEEACLGLAGKGLLAWLEQLGILDPLTREVVVDRVMALESKEISPGLIKWVVLIALFNQPDKKPALNLFQEMVLSEAFDILH